jgi:hypothetical protein
MTGTDGSGQPASRSRCFRDYLLELLMQRALKGEEIDVAELPRPAFAGGKT